MVLGEFQELFWW